MPESYDPIPAIIREVRKALIDVGPNIDKKGFVISLLTMAGHVYVDHLKIGPTEQFKHFVYENLQNPDLWEERDAS